MAGTARRHVSLPLFVMAGLVPRLSMDAVGGKVAAEAPRPFLRTLCVWMAGTGPRLSGSFLWTGCMALILLVSKHLPVIWTRTEVTPCATTIAYCTGF
jgi:hypothetical protein